MLEYVCGRYLLTYICADTEVEKHRVKNFKVMNETSMNNLPQWNESTRQKCWIWRPNKDLNTKPYHLRALWKDFVIGS